MIGTSSIHIKHNYDKTMGKMKGWTFLQAVEIFEAFTDEYVYECIFVWLAKVIV
jgi:hypothetical protein